MNTAHHEHHVNTGDRKKAEVKIASKPLHIIAGQPADLIISITESGRHIPLKTVHEMKIHLLIVNKELSWFAHIHPEEQPDGTYRVSATFPAAGQYLLFSDYTPNEGSADVYMHSIEVTGVPAAWQKQPVTKFIVTVDGYTVCLLNGDDFITNRTQDLQFSILKDGHMLMGKDMQLYLGATAHIVMISKVGYDFLHIHPIADNYFPIHAETYIEKAGIYRMWVQFKVNNTVHTADFTVSVSNGEKPVGDRRIPHH